MAEFLFARHSHRGQRWISNSNAPHSIILDRAKSKWRHILRNGSNANDLHLVYAAGHNYYFFEQIEKNDRAAAVVGRGWGAKRSFPHFLFLSFRCCHFHAMLSSIYDSSYVNSLRRYFFSSLCSFSFSLGSHSVCETVHVLSVKWHFNLSHRVRVATLLLLLIWNTWSKPAAFFSATLCGTRRRRCFITDERNDAKETAAEPIVQRMCSSRPRDVITTHTHTAKATEEGNAELVRREQWAEWYAAPRSSKQ